MNKTLNCILLLFFLAILILVSPHNAAGQGKIKLEKGTSKKTNDPKANATAKIAMPRDQVDQHRPVIFVLPRPGAGGFSTETAKSGNQVAQIQEPSSPSTCDWTLLLLNEVGSYYLTLQNVGCLGCNLPTELSQSTAGVLGFSHSPTGPWTETLTVYTQLDFSGNGRSEDFYIKGVNTGASTFHGQNFWSSFDVPFQVQPCSCPEIPIVP
jgi:hypothetical protein